MRLFNIAIHNDLFERSCSKIALARAIYTISFTIKMFARIFNWLAMSSTKTIIARYVLGLWSYVFYDLHVALYGRIRMTNTLFVAININSITINNKHTWRTALRNQSCRRMLCMTSDSIWKKLEQSTFYIFIRWQLRPWVNFNVTTRFVYMSALRWRPNHNNSMLMYINRPIDLSLSWKYFSHSVFILEYPRFTPGPIPS